jgi:hypothetical protein
MNAVEGSSAATLVLIEPDQSPSSLVSINIILLPSKRVEDAGSIDFEHDRTIIKSVGINNRNTFDIQSFLIDFRPLD